MSSSTGDYHSLYWSTPKTLSLQIQRIVRKGRLVLLEGNDELVAGALFRVSTPRAAKRLEAAVIREQGRMRLQISGKPAPAKNKSASRPAKDGQIDLADFGPSSMVLIFRDSATLVIGDWPEKLLSWVKMKESLPKVTPDQN